MLHGFRADDRGFTYRRLYDAHYPHVLAYCARRVGRQDAADVAAEVFSVAWRRIDDVPQGYSQRAWLYGVAHRVVSHHWRTLRRRNRLTAKVAALPPESNLDTEMVVVRHHDHRLVLAAATRLRPKHREVLRLALWEELSHQQIADVTGSTAAAVRQRLYRAKRALAREYARLGGTVPPPQSAPRKAGEQ